MQNNFSTQAYSCVNTLWTKRAGSASYYQNMERGRWRIKTDPNDKVDRVNELKDICSICLSEPELQRNRLTRTKESNELISICLCSGHRPRVHKRCIEDFIELSGCTSCPFCMVRYDYTTSRKGFLAYIREQHLERDFATGAAAIGFSVYLFLIGFSICYNTLVDDKYDKELIKAHNLQEKYIGKTSGAQLWQRAGFGWARWTLFCFTCTLTTLFLMIIVSTILNLLIRQIFRYKFWARTHLKVNIKPYRLDSMTNTYVQNSLFPSSSNNASS